MPCSISERLSVATTGFTLLSLYFFLTKKSLFLVKWVFEVHAPEEESSSGLIVHGVFQAVDLGKPNELPKLSNR
jgi:hypothetical protein